MKLKLQFCAIMALISSVPAMAQDNLVDNIYKERRELVKRSANIDNTLAIGWFVGAADSFEFNDILVRYLPLSNLISARTGELTVLMTEKLTSKLTEDALVGNLDIVYTSAMEGSRLLSKGWKPLVGRRENLVGTIIMRTDISNSDSLEGKKIIGVDGGITTNYVKYALSKSGVLPKVLFVEQNTSQNDLIKVLRSKQVDGVIVREIFADRFVKENAGYKIIFKAPAAKGHTIFVSPNANALYIENLRKTMLDLNPDNKSGKKILIGLDGYSEADKVPFVDRSGADFQNETEVYNVLLKLPKFDRFDARAENDIGISNAGNVSAPVKVEKEEKSMIVPIKK